MVKMTRIRASHERVKRMPPESIDLALSIVVKTKQAIHVHMSYTTQE